MCYDKEYLNKTHDEIPYKEIISFIDDVTGYNPVIFLTGGEPFLHSRIIDILRHIKKKGLHCGVCTNGTSLNEDLITCLAKINPDNLIFSIHGTEKIHDEITKVKGSYKKVIHNLKRFCELKKDTHVMVNCAILPENIDSIEKLILTCEKIRIDSFRLEHLSFLTTNEVNKHVKTWKNHFPKCKMKLHQYINDEDISFLSKKIKVIKNKKFKLPILFNPYLNDNEIDEWYRKQFKHRRRCLFLWFGTFINSKGDVYSCHTLGCKFGNIKDKPLKEIFNSKKATKLRHLIKKNLMPACSRCCKL
jgi:MoaA/NifB/PqqE/SkfB family radical SAM enzyme